MVMGSSLTIPGCSRQVPESVMAPSAGSRHRAHPDLPTLRRPDSLSPPDVMMVQSTSTAFDNISAPSSPPSGTSSATQKMFQKRKSEPEETTLRHPYGALLKRSRQTGHTHPGEAILLADRLRPRILDEFVGQTHLTDHNTLLFSGDGELTTENIIFWGPPGWVLVSIGTGTAPYSSRSLWQVWKDYAGADSFGVYRRDLQGSERDKLERE